MRKKVNNPNARIKVAFVIEKSKIPKFKKIIGKI
jgi:hypothetical protein